MSIETTETRKPKFTLNLNLPSGGQLETAIWENDASKEGESFTTFGVTIKRHYYDEDNKQWKPSKGFRSADLLPLAFTAQEPYRNVEKLNQQ